LWNVFFKDVSAAAEKRGGQEAKFADDLSVHKTYPAEAPNSKVLEDLHLCQQDVHNWGVQNRMAFDTSKEEFVVIHHVQGEGADFRLLGPVFDPKLQMHTAVQKLVHKARPKLQALLRTRRYYNTSDLVLQFKAHVLCVLESATPAVYHAAASVLEPLDHVLGSFLRQLELPAEEAFLQYNLGPLAWRRDVAMLGLLHKCALGLAHSKLRALFPGQRTPPHKTTAGALRREVSGAHAKVGLRTRAGLQLAATGCCGHHLSKGLPDCTYKACEKGLRCRRRELGNLL
jgi:hypothetical protein